MRLFCAMTLSEPPDNLSSLMLVVANLGERVTTEVKTPEQVSVAAP
jgi:hypothetical protein